MLSPLCNQAENVFIVQGGLRDPAHDRAMVKVEEAVRTPATESFQQVQSINQQLQLEKQQQASHQMTTGIEQH